MQGIQRIVRLAVMVVLAVSIAACSATFRNHGYMPPEGDVDQLMVGIDNRTSLRATIGAPGTSGLLTDGAWYYQQSRFRHSAYNAPDEIEREVLAISFNEDGLVENIERFGLEDGQVVVLSRRVTESNIKGVSFLRQLFGSFGNVDVSSLL